MSSLLIIITAPLALLTSLAKGGTGLGGLDVKTILKPLPVPLEAREQLVSLATKRRAGGRDAGWLQHSAEGVAGGGKTYGRVLCFDETTPRGHET